MTVADIFETLDYGPAPESTAIADQWLADKGRKFGLFIGGAWVDPAAGAWFDSINPATDKRLAAIAQATRADIDAAVAAARSAQPGWAKLGGHGRARVLYALARLVQKHSRLLAVLETLDNGKPIRETRDIDVPLVARHFYHHAGWAQLVEREFAGQEPLGVVGQIVPWNFPLMFTSWKMGPALAAGNCVVMKPAELTPLSTLRIAELMREVGFPPGVVNIVPGYGSVAGQRLADHPDVHKLAFTGSTAVGRKIVERSAGNLKKLQLELGGKGANVVFEDANIPVAVGGSAFAIFHNQGQACIAGSRLILHESIADEFLDKFVGLAKSIRLGDPLDETTEMGPLTSKVHQERVLNYCEVAKDEGGEILTGGKAPDDPALAKGCYVEPTVVRAKPTDRVCQEEVFGPFVSVTTFRDEEEVIEIVNGTEYGLGNGLWTRDLQRAHRMAEQMNSGMVWINCYKRVNPGSPFGGVRSSGYGREMGFDAMREYTQVKSVWVNVDAQIPPYYKR